MDPDKKKRLEEKGWTVGATEDFLRLTEEEAAVIALRLRRCETSRLTGDRASVINARETRGRDGHRP